MSPLMIRNRPIVKHDAAAAFWEVAVTCWWGGVALNDAALASA